VRLHARITETLEGIYGVNAALHAPELAHHYSEAEAVLGTEKLTHYSVTTGEAALDEFAFESAGNHFSMALGALNEEVFDATEASILRGIGLSQAAVGQLVDAHRNLGAAVDYYFENGDHKSAIEIAVNPLMNIFSRLPDPVARLK
jgi:hypothetical protein